jgi:hypothetical protein
MQKIDYKKELKTLYRPSIKKIEIVVVPAMQFLMIDGQGDPNTSQEYKNAIEAIYSVAYTIKFMVKKGSIGIDYGVMPLEGLWWVDDMTQFSADRKDEWLWTAMIMQPELVNKTMVAEACETVQKKKNPVALPKMRFETYAEGQAAQIMYIGPYADEGPRIAEIHDHIETMGGKRTGKHHEIYISDMRRTAPEKLKTIIRQPFK